MNSPTRASGGQAATYLALVVAGVWLSGGARPGLAAGAASTSGAPGVTVEVEEDVYRYEPADNGAGPMWCAGSTCLVRWGDEVFASGLETLAGVKPLNNCRWTLYQRGASGWDRVAFDAQGRTREPCPLVAFGDGRFLLSANPTLAPDAYSGPARPEVLEFDARDPRAKPRVLLPEWQGQPKFTEHSYRSFAADGPNRELVLFQNIDYTHAEWTFLDRGGRWSARGQLRWPWGADYAKPQPIRVCYPNVALRARAVHVCGVSDIVEPNPEWRAYKKQLTGREWDYDFRRLFYAWTPDIAAAPFREWIEIASRERTCGWIMPGDLWLAPDGAAHLVWTERALDPRLRDKFFPDARQSHALGYATVRHGEVTHRRTLLLLEEGQPGLTPSAPRFHATSDHRLFLLYHVSGSDADGRNVAENRLMELRGDGTSGPAVRVPFQKPFTAYFTATVRGGSAPATVIDVLGQRAGTGPTLSYARVSLTPSTP